jgi:hypothetical protein
LPSPEHAPATGTRDAYRADARDWCDGSDCCHADAIAVGARFGPDYEEFFPDINNSSKVLQGLDYGFFGYDVWIVETFLRL